MKDEDQSLDTTYTFWKYSQTDRGQRFSFYDFGHQQLLHGPYRSKVPEMISCLIRKNGST